MNLRSFRAKPTLALFLLALGLIAGCGEDSDSGTGPNVPPVATHFEITVKMSSIWAQNDCENTPDNPGDFRYRLIVRTPDELGNQVIVSDTGNRELSISDGDRQGVVMNPIHFLVPNDPDSRFQVEYWVGEYDPETDFERHS